MLLGDGQANALVNSSVSEGGRERERDGECKKCGVLEERI